MDDLIPPERAKEIRRAALRHASGMLKVSLGEWDPQTYNPESARNDAEEELLREAVEQIADELRARSLVGTYRACSVCGLSYLVRKGGVIGHHVGMDAAGFSTGERCDGAGQPPRAD
ncbi:hypothetical protein ACW7N6_38330 [Streptomyces sp. UC1A3]